MISSPSLISASSAAISVAWVQEVVSSAFAVPVFFSSHALQRFVKGPSPQIL